MGLKAQARQISSSIKKNRQKISVGPKSLRGQLVLSMWLGSMAIYVPLNIARTLQDREVTSQLTRRTLEQQGSLFYFRVKTWRQSISQRLENPASALTIRNLDPVGTKVIFDRLSSFFPYRFWQLWSRDGDLLVGKNLCEATSRQRILSTQFFLASKQGKSGHGIFKDCLLGKSFYIESLPVYGTGISSFPRTLAKPVGVIGIAIALTDIDKDSEFSGVYKQIVGLIDPAAFQANSHSPWRLPLSLQNGDTSGMELLMVSKEGDVIFPSSTINDSISTQKPVEIKKGPWGPFVTMGQKANALGQFMEIKSRGKDYFVYTRRIDPEWSLVSVSDKESSYMGVYQKIFRDTLYQLLALVGSTIVIFLICKRTARPIQLAGDAIQDFSKGNFDARISTSRTDEIGRLFGNINQTGEKLRELFNSQLAHAVTDQQIETARGIQKGFIVERLPSGQGVELAGDFYPAYEIGADWYDAIRLGDITYIVIADVCDKGIASALFMSVFRTLIRYSILDENSELERQGLVKSLEDVITQVNEYMASNHGAQTMFATLFLGAYVRAENRLSYVCAGHEIPFIIRDHGVLEQLEPTGPAIGVFGGAKFRVNTIELFPDQILFTYTDGLVDARSPANVSWGLDRVKSVLASIDPRTTTAAELLETMTEKVRVHRGDADQFDDLTMLVMKITET